MPQRTLRLPLETKVSAQKNYKVRIPEEENPMGELSSTAQIGIGVGVTLAVAAAVLIPLGVLGILTSSSSTEVTETPVPSPACVFSGPFMQTNNVVGEVPSFGPQVTASQDGKIVSVLEAPMLAVSGEIIQVGMYSKNDADSTFNLLSKSDTGIVLPQRIREAGVSQTGTFLGVTLFAELDTSFGAVKFGTRSGSSWFTNMQTVTVNPVRDPVKLIFDTDRDNRCYVGWNFLNQGTVAGSVRVYDHNGVQFTETTSIMNPEAKVGDGFGIGMGQNGNFMAISQFGTLQDIANFPAIGCNYYSRDSSMEEWVYQGLVPAPNVLVVQGQPEVPAPSFGFDVAMSVDGLWLVVSAPFMDGTSIAVSGVGAIYVYYRSAATLSFPTEPLQVLRPDNETENDYFGTSVRIAGSYLFIGSTFQNRTKHPILTYLIDSASGTITKAVDIDPPVDGMGSVIGAGAFGYVGFFASDQVQEDTYTVIAGAQALTDVSQGRLLAYTNGCTVEPDN